MNNKADGRSKIKRIQGISRREENLYREADGLGRRRLDKGKNQNSEQKRVEIIPKQVEGRNKSVGEKKNCMGKTMDGVEDD